jgi:uncharacterized membrane protein
MFRSPETADSTYSGVTMRASRKLIGEFAAVFLIGAIVGGLLVWDYTDTTLAQFMSKSSDPDSVIVSRINQKYVQEYHLSADELNRIQPLIREMAQHTSQIRRQFGVDILANLDDYHEKIAQQLTPEHRAAYEKATQEKRNQLSALLLPDQGPSDQGQK